MLIVDDDVRVTTALSRNISSGRTVEIAHDYDTAIELARRLKPDLVIVDLRLGHECGIETIREVRAELPDSAIALVSGYVSIDVTVRAVKAGADIVMAKPITGKELLGRVCSQECIDTNDTPSLAQVEAEYIARILTDCGGNVSETARRLGIYRSSLQRKLRKQVPRV